MTAHVAASGPKRSAGLRERERAQLEVVLRLLATDPASLSSIRDPADGWRVHVDDSLSGVGLVEGGTDPARAAGGGAPRIADVGAGAGFPGLVLAVALPAANVDLIESVARKCEFMNRAVAAARIENAHVICDRAESWAAKTPPDGGRESYDVVTARAVGRLSTLAELASPLLRDGGRLVAWKGRRNEGEEAELERGADRLAMRLERVSHVGPPAGSDHRHLYLLRKLGPTPERLPRRPGMAKKHPQGSR